MSVSANRWPAENRKESIGLDFFIRSGQNLSVTRDAIIQCVCDAFVREEFECNNAFNVSDRLNKANDIHHLHQ